jgi:hypothetical protein
MSGVDGFFRHYGPAIKQLAQSAAPALAAGGFPAAAALTAVVGQGADSYAQLRSQLGD